MFNVSDQDTSNQLIVIMCTCLQVYSGLYAVYTVNMFNMTLSAAGGVYYCLICLHVCSVNIITSYLCKHVHL